MTVVIPDWFGNGRVRSIVKEIQLLRPCSCKGCNSLPTDPASLAAVIISWREERQQFAMMAAQSGVAWLFFTSFLAYWELCDCTRNGMWRYFCIVSGLSMFRFVVGYTMSVNWSNCSVSQSLTFLASAFVTVCSSYWRKMFSAKTAFTRCNYPAETLA